MKSQQDWRGWHNEGQPRSKDVLSIPFQCRLKLYAFSRNLAAASTDVRE
jgi:hypothetical protein